MLFKPKWFKNESDLVVGDLVYFEKSESELGSPWILGMVAEIEPSRDGLVRKAAIKYRNASEAEDRTTRRNVRNLCKIWSEDDWNLQDDLAVLESRLKSLPNSDEILDGIVFPDPVADALHADLLADGCCCVSQCAIVHSSTAPLRSYQALQSIAHVACDLYPVLPAFAVEMSEQMPEMDPDVELPLDNLSDYLLNFCPA